MLYRFITCFNKKCVMEIKKKDLPGTNVTCIVLRGVNCCDWSFLIASMYLLLKNKQTNCDLMIVWLRWCPFCVNPLTPRSD